MQKNNIKKIAQIGVKWSIIYLAALGILDGCGGCAKRIKVDSKQDRKPASIVAPITLPSKHLPALNLDALPKPTNSSAGSSGSSGAGSSGSSGTGSGGSSGAGRGDNKPTNNRMNNNANIEMHPDPLAPPVGIANIGNTCYMNAVLQVIAAIYSDRIPSNAPLAQIIGLINASDGSITSDEVHTFIEKLKTNSSEWDLFKGTLQHIGNQQDAKEVLSSFNALCKEQLLDRYTNSVETTSDDFILPIELTTGRELNLSDIIKENNIIPNEKGTTANLLLNLPGKIHIDSTQDGVHIRGEEGEVNDMQLNLPNVINMEYIRKDEWRIKVKNLNKGILPLNHLYYNIKLDIKSTKLYYTDSNNTEHTVTYHLGSDIEMQQEITSKINPYSRELQILFKAQKEESEIYVTLQLNKMEDTSKLRLFYSDRNSDIPLSFSEVLYRNKVDSRMQLYQPTYDYTTSSRPCLSFQRNNTTIKNIQKFKDVANITIKGISYSLHACIAHIGSHMGGHYVAYVKRGDGWYYASDTSIEIIESSRVLEVAEGKNAVLWFYK